MADGDSKQRFSGVCVFCGSSPGKTPEYVEAARQLGAELARRNIRLVYGGGNVGVMGALASAVLDNGGQVLGIIPEALMPREVSGNMLGEVIVVKDMHTRKALMSKHADAFVALPGGFGTLEELFEVVTWQQLGIHRKPIGVVNVAGYYDSLLALIEHAHGTGFVRDVHREIVVFDADPTTIIDKLEAHQPPKCGFNWMTIEQS